MDAEEESRMLVETWMDRGDLERGTFRVSPAPENFQAAELAQLFESAPDMSEEVEQLNEKIEELEGENDTLRDEVSDAKEEIKERDARIEKLKEKLESGDEETGLALDSLKYLVREYLTSLHSKSMDIIATREALAALNAALGQ
jgi:chromosome segregation ATPase